MAQRDFVQEPATPPWVWLIVLGAIFAAAFGLIGIQNSNSSTGLSPVGNDGPAVVVEEEVESTETPQPTSMVGATSTAESITVATSTESATSTPQATSTTAPTSTPTATVTLEPTNTPASTPTEEPVDTGFPIEDWAKVEGVIILVSCGWELETHIVPWEDGTYVGANFECRNSEPVGSPSDSYSIVPIAQPSKNGGIVSIGNYKCELDPVEDSWEKALKYLNSTVADGVISIDDMKKGSIDLTMCLNPGPITIEMP